MTIWYEQAGSGDAVVLLAFSAADAGMWDAQWEPLAERFRGIRADYRGFGHTPYAADRPYSDSGDVAEVLAELGVERAALVAWRASYRRRSWSSSTGPVTCPPWNGRVRSPGSSWITFDA